MIRLHRRVARSLLAASKGGLLLSVALHCAQAEPLQVPGSTVTMDAPDGFRISELFSGFENPDTQSSILIAELPREAYAEISGIFSSREAATEALAAQGVVVTAVSSVTIGGESVSLVTGEQSTQGAVFDKYFVVLAGDNTVLITINVFEDDPLTAQAARASLESVSLSAPPTLGEQIEQLSFSYRDLEPFRSRLVIAGAAALLSTFDGTDPSGEQPAIIIAASLAALDTSDMQAASERLIADTAELQSASVSSGEFVETDGGEAYRVEATHDGLLAIHYLWSLPDNSYIRMIAKGRNDLLDPLSESIATIAASVAPR